MERLRDFLGKWLKYWRSVGKEGLWEDIYRDLDEFEYLLEYIWDLIKLVFQIILRGVESVPSMVKLILELVKLLFNIINFILGFFIHGFIRLWDREEYKKMEEEKWKDYH